MGLAKKYKPWNERYEVNEETECWEWIGTISSGRDGGYGMVSVDRKQKSAHRLFYALHNGPIPAGMLVCHKCDVRHCVNPEHLFLGTAQENTADMIRKNRQVKGEERWNAKLTREEALEIRASPIAQRKLAKMYNISRGVVQRIKAGKTWKG